MANIVVQSYGENRGQIDRHEAEGGVRNAMFAVFTKSRKEERRGKSWKAKAKNERTSVYTAFLEGHHAAVRLYSLYRIL